MGVINRILYYQGRRSRGNSSIYSVAGFCDHKDDFIIKEIEVDKDLI
jgi:hypothetical protein